MDRNRFTSPEAVTLFEENDNEVFELLKYEYISCNLCFVEFLCQMHTNGLCNLSMSINQQVAVTMFIKFTPRVRQHFFATQESAHFLSLHVIIP